MSKTLKRPGLQAKAAIVNKLQIQRKQLPAFQPKNVYKQKGKQS